MPLDLGFACIWILICLTGYTLLTSLSQSVIHDETCQRLICCIGKDEDCR